MEKMVTIEGEYPQIVSARELAGRLIGRGWLSPKQLKEQYRITDEQWPNVQSELREAWREVNREFRKANNSEQLYLSVSERLSEHALAIPYLATGEDLNKIAQELETVKIQAIENYIFKLVMDPRYRARRLAGRYMSVPIFQEFAYLIESSYFSFLRGNYPSCFMTLLPVIEGFLLRWAKRNDPMRFNKSDWVARTPERNPLLSLPLFADIWASTAASILEKHLYKDTRTGPTFANFNRHLAMHLHEQKDFATPINIMRSFLLLDLLGGLYLCEINNTDIIDLTLDDQVIPHLDAYLSVICFDGVGAESVMRAHVQYERLKKINDEIGDPRVYWKNPRTLSFKDMIQSALARASKPK